MKSSSDSLLGKRLYLAHLAERIEAMETGEHPLCAIAYRLFARRLSAAMAGYPELLLAKQLCRRHPAIAQALEARHFESHGALRGAGAGHARAHASALLGRLIERT